MTGDLWPLPLGRCLKRPKEVLPSGGSRRPSDSGSVPLALNHAPPPPMKCPEPPSAGGGGAVHVYVLLQPPYSPLHYFCGIESSVCFPGSPARLGLMIAYCILVPRTKTCTFSHSACLCRLDSFIHVVTHLQIFIACSMPDSVLGVEQLS